MFICFEIQPLADSGGTPRANHASLRYLAVVWLQTCGGESELALVGGEMRFTLTLCQVSSAVHSFSWPLLTGLAPVAPGNRAWGMGGGGIFVWPPIYHHFYTFLLIVVMWAGGLHETHGSQAWGGFSQQRGSSYTCPLHPNPIVPKDQCPGVGPAPKQSSWGPQEGGLLMGTSRRRLCFVLLLTKSFALGRSLTHQGNWLWEPVVRKLLHHLPKPWLP